MTRALAALAVVGVSVSAYLTWVHYAGIEPVCTGVSDCERVQNSPYAELAGIPVAVVGLVGYLAILASLGARPEVTAALAYVGVAFSGYLTWIELFQISAICQWCVASALVVTAIAVVASARALRGDGPKISAVAGRGRSRSCG